MCDHQQQKYLEAHWQCQFMALSEPSIAESLEDSSLETLEMIVVLTAVWNPDLCIPGMNCQPAVDG